MTDNNTVGDGTFSGDLAISGGNITTAVTFDSTATATGDLTANANTTLGNSNTVDTLTGNLLTSSLPRGYYPKCFSF